MYMQKVGPISRGMLGGSLATQQSPGSIVRQPLWRRDVRSKSGGGVGGACLAVCVRACLCAIVSMIV